MAQSVKYFTSDIYRSPRDIKPHHVVLFYTRECEELAINIARKSDGSILLGNVEISKFPDNFPNIFIHNAEMLRFVHCAFIGNMVSPTTIFEEISVIMMLPRYGVKSLKIILPYFATGTMERIEKQGEVPTAFTLAQMLSLCPLTQHGPAQLITLDIHTLQNQFYFGPNLTVLLMTAMPLLISVLKQEKAKQEQIQQQRQLDLELRRVALSGPSTPSIAFPAAKPPLPALPLIPVPVPVPVPVAASASGSAMGDLGTTACAADDDVASLGRQPSDAPSDTHSTCSAPLLTAFTPTVPVTRPIATPAASTDAVAHRETAPVGSGMDAVQSTCGEGAAGSGGGGSSGSGSGSVAADGDASVDDKVTVSPVPSTISPLGKDDAFPDATIPGQSRKTLKTSSSTNHLPSVASGSHPSLSVDNSSRLSSTVGNKAFLSPATLTVSSSFSSLDRSLDCQWDAAMHLGLVSGAAGGHAQHSTGGQYSQAGQYGDRAQPGKRKMGSEGCVAGGGGSGSVEQDAVPRGPGNSGSSVPSPFSHLDDSTPDEITIVFPDLGAAKRYSGILSMFPQVVCSKKREGNVRKVSIVEGDCRGKHCVVVDDLVHSGGTMLETMGVLKAAGAARVDGYATHGVFENESWRKFVAAHEAGILHTFYASNTHPQTHALAGVAPFKILCVSDIVLPLIIRNKKYQLFTHDCPHREAHSELESLHSCFSL